MTIEDTVRALAEDLRELRRAVGPLLTAEQPLTAYGTWTPTLDLTTNVAAATASAGYYIRVGNVVKAGVRLEIDVTAAAATVLGISLPIASAIGSVANVIGSGNSTTMGGEVRGHVAGDRAEFAYTSSVTANTAFYIHFIYTII